LINKNTLPERIVQNMIKKLCISAILHSKEIIGTPDITIPELNLIIFIHGCYWHRHSCQSPQKGDEKIREKDSAIVSHLKSEGYTVLILWECNILAQPLSIENRLKNLIVSLKKSNF